MNLADVVLCDFETRSEADLKLIGGRNYAAHPTTEVVCCCFYADGEHILWVPGMAPPPFAPYVAAHNADGFDTHIWRRVGWPEPELWIDTSAVARTAGLPGKLADLGRRYGFVSKDDSGSAVTKALSGFALPASRTDKATGEPIVSVPEDVKAALREYHAARKALAADGRSGWPAIPPVVLAFVARYCRNDVAVLVDVWPEIADFVELEPEVLAAWRAANDRGIPFDRELAQALLDADAHASAAALGVPVESVLDEAFVPALEAAGMMNVPDLAPAAIRKLLASQAEKGYIGRGKAAQVLSPRAQELLRGRLEVSLLRYSPAFTQRMSGLGVHLPDAKYETVEPLLHHADERVRTLAAKRFAVASIASGKLRAGLAHVSADGYMRDNVKYYGAHTGRGAGGGMQLQNIPHPEGTGRDGAPVKKWKDARVCAEAALAPERPAWNQAEISMLLRACIHAPPGEVLAAADFSGVEARGNAYAAHDVDAVENFRAGGDAYAPLAIRLFGLEPWPGFPLTADPAREAYEAWKVTNFSARDTSKKAELGCGYSMGPPKFKLTAEKGGMVWRDPRECKGEDACVDPLCGVLLRDARGNLFTHGAYTIVHGWRAAHPAIVAFWRALADAAVEAVDSATCVTVPADVALAFDFVRGDLALVLPSGRPIVYRRAAIEEGEYGPQVRFEGQYGPSRLYGGLLCENAIQAMCRDLLTNGMVNAEAAGLPVRLTVHDEIVASVARARGAWALEALIAAMCTLPSWAGTMPITAEGWIAERYRK